jgi:Uma2 family endonuclease
MSVSEALPPHAAAPLESGDRLTRCEFEKRYALRPDIKKAELIEGVVYVPSPTRFTLHAQPHAHLVAWLGLFASLRRGVELGDNATVRLDGDNVVQPDVLLRFADGTSRLSADGYIEGPPELIAEVVSSSAAYDLHDKMHVYRRTGVQEYVTWQVLEKRIDWFRLEEGVYRPLPPGRDGTLRSLVFPGLVLAPAPLIAGDLAAVLTLQQRELTKAGRAFRGPASIL